MGGAKRKRKQKGQERGGRVREVSAEAVETEDRRGRQGPQRETAKSLGLLH